MSGGVVKAIAEKIYASHVRINVNEMQPDSTVVLLPPAKSGDYQALTSVLDELDINMDTDSLKQEQWVYAQADTARRLLDIEDLTIRQGLVPRVVGMGAKDAVYLLESLGMRARIHGIGRVRSQSILPGQRIVKGQTIVLTLK